MFSYIRLLTQIADKLCAMYERFGVADTVSGRYRDLVDLLLISMFVPIDLASTVTAVEQERAVRGISALPITLESPGQGWATQWEPTARQSPLINDHHNFEAALIAAGRCYNRVLGSLPVTDEAAMWNHERSVWEPIPGRVD